jgi:hypothetical protein
MSSFSKRLQRTSKPVTQAPTGVSPAYWSKWSNGPSTADTWFPLAAWQAHIDTSFGGVVSPYSDLGAGLADAGMNVIDGTWDWLESTGPSYVSRAIALNMKVIASGPDMSYLQSNPSHDSAIIGWQTGDEFDMNRSNENAPFGPNSPTTVHNAYLTGKTQDPTRPQNINFGKPTGGGFYTANGGYDTGSQLGDLTLYQQSADMTSIDYYWYTDPWESTHGAYLYGISLDTERYYARRSDPNKPVWMFVETSRPWDISSPAITPAQMEAAIWNSIVHGARGIVYFNHDFGAGTGSSSGELGVWSASYYDRTTGDAIIAKLKTVNARIMGLAPVLNSAELGTINGSTGRETFTSYMTVSSSASGIPIDIMVRQYGGQTYVFAQASGSSSHQASGSTTGTFTWLAGGSGSITVRDESRTVTMTNGVWTDTFTAYQLHIYVF